MAFPEFKIVFVVYAFIATTIFTTACSNIYDPTFMPSGYTYHREYHKAPPAPKAPEIGYPYDAVKNATIIQQWRGVSGRMMDRLESDLGLAPGPVFVSILPDHNAFNASFDYALRDELRARGYVLSANGPSVLNLLPEAFLPGDEKFPVDVNEYNDDYDRIDVPVHRDVPDDVTVKITASRAGMLIGAAQDNFKLPFYGYIRGEGQDRISPRPVANKIPKQPENAPQDLIGGEVMREPIK
jgi:hypothetical protein